MADKDDLPARGIPFRAIVDAVGVAVGGTADIDTLIQRGMRPACQVDAVGVDSGGSGDTIEDLARRGIEYFCVVDGDGVEPDTSATVDELRRRGIPAICPVDPDGVAQGGSASLEQLRTRGINFFCPLDEDGEELSIVGTSIRLSAATVEENSAAGTLVGTLSIFGTFTGTPAFTLEDDAGGLFVLDGDDLEVDGELDFETATSHQIEVSVADIDPLPAVNPRTFTITVTDAALAQGPEASVLSVTSGATDNEPDFEVDLPSGFGDHRDAAIGDINVVLVQINQTGDYVEYFQDPLEDPISDPATITGVDTLPDGTHNFQQELRREDAQTSDRSNTVPHTIDANGPVFTSVDEANIGENAQLSHTLSATDATDVTFTVRDVGDDPTSVDSAEFEISGTTLRWASNGTQDYETPGDDGTDNTYIVVVRATDENANTTDQTITITVTNVNDAPTVANAISNQTATDGTPFSFQFASNVFADQDAGDSLTYSASLSPSGSLPAWLTFTPATRTFSGTPATGDIGTITIRVTATDTGALSVFDDFDLEVQAEAPATTTWNSADKAAALTLSNGDLTMTHTGAQGYAHARSVASMSSGKKYFELTVTTLATPSQSGVGIGNASASLTTYNDANGIHWFFNGTVYQNGGSVRVIESLAQGDVACIAIDEDNNRIWFRTNGGNWNNNASSNPATNTDGIDTSAVSGDVFAMANARDVNDVFTANFGATAYAQTPPSGFGNF